MNPDMDSKTSLGLPSASTASAPKRVIGKKLRVLLVMVLGLFSILMANGIYLFFITWLQYFQGQVYENLFYQFMFLAHLILGFLLVAPVIVFGVGHFLAARNRRNRRAVKIGYALFAIALVVLLSGVLLTRQMGFDLKNPSIRNVVYWLHIITPIMAIWLYWLHRLVGPRIKWAIGQRIGLGTLALVAVMVVLQTQDPRRWNQAGPTTGDVYFEPSLARTATGNFIPARALQNDEYCLRCHPNVYDSWFHSAHHFSSFNNPAYLYAVRQTRKKMLDRNGTVHAARWCAGCHDPVPFFSGAFDNPDYDDVHDATSQAGITCTVCHAITHVGDLSDSMVRTTRGNADYVIEEPIQYPFTFSQNTLLQRVNELLVKAKPNMHKQTFLKPLHKTPEFCGTCHKVHLPKELTAYKDFLRGQNHYDSFLLSGVSGHGASSFYYPPIAETNCNECHMPPQASTDFGARQSPKLGQMAVHDHFFPGANTALPWWRGDDATVERARQLLTNVTRVDIFGVREGGTIDGQLHAPLGPDTPVLEAGKDYLLDTVIRTTKLGHHLTQGTVDSNELWLELTVSSGGRVIGICGGLSDVGEVDPWSHFVNVFMLDRHGNRVAERNAEDIFVPLYDHQLPPGAGQTVHYGLRVPDDLQQPVEVLLKLKYRKFDKGYLDFMRREFRPGDIPFRELEASQGVENRLPITVLAEDRVVFDLRTAEGTLVPAERGARKLPDEWERWNDYGIGMLLAGKSQLRQAAEAFRQVERLGKSTGALNLARAQFAEGDLDGATDALRRATAMDPPPPAWTLAWLSGEVSRQQGYLENAAESFRSVLDDDTTERRQRKFDFSLDYRIRNSLGLTLLDLADVAEARQQSQQVEELLSEAEMEFRKVLEVDQENVTAHASLASVYHRLGNESQANYHRAQQVRYKMDDNAADVARPAARRQYPAANHAAEPLVIYWLHRAQVPGLPADAVTPAPE